MLEINDFCVFVDTKYLIKDLSLFLNKGDKLAVIGEEGNGKSTLLKSLLGIAEYSKVTGTVNFYGNKVGYLEQSINEIDLDKVVSNYLFSEEVIYDSNLYKYLKLLDLKEVILERVIRTLSGGEKVKVSILKLLLNEADILFLDEPTNDLDVETLEWLEDFINSTSKPVVFISHDETLLANTANIVLHLELIKNKTECRHTVMRTSYDIYVDSRIKAIEKASQMALSEKREMKKKQDKLKQIFQKVEHQQNVISRGNPHGAKMLKRKIHSLKSQERRLNNTNLTEYPDVEESINFFFEEVNIPSFKVILDLEIPELKTINNRTLSKNIKLNIVGKRHVCIVGKNGIGKTTLLKLIYNNLCSRSDLKIGYMPQMYDDILDNYTSALDFITEVGDKGQVTKARMYLGNMNFTKEEMTGSIKSLSNGTKAKLFLMKLVLDKCDVLILDEPTRNVSPLSNPIIRRVLKNFNGTIISVSHDRKYIEEVIDELYILTEEGLEKLTFLS